MAETVDIEWVEIPEGEFLTGLSEEQRAEIRTRLRAEFEIDQLDRRTRTLIEGLAEKYRRTAREEVYYLGDNLTLEERERKPGFDDPLTSFLLAEAELERIPLQRRVWLNTFYIARFPITHEQCDIFYSSSFARQWSLHKCRSRRPPEDLPNMPEEIHWEVADAFCHRLGGRLPTVFEWEKAARGTDGRLYPWGNEWDPSRGNFGYEHRPSYSQKHGIARTVVDAYPGGVSLYGVWDVAGNLSDWTMTVMPPRVKSNRQIPWTKGGNVKRGGNATEWFWSILARQNPGWFDGPPVYIGFRPVLSQWQRHHWQGFCVEKDSKRTSQA
jgi:formylglycine-generating enzyme required for sulfatase activity